MRATTLRGVHRVLVGIGLVLFVGSVLFGLVEQAAMILGGLVLIMYAGSAFIFWRILRGRVLKRIDADLGRTRQTLASESLDLPLADDAFDRASAARDDGDLIPADEYLDAADRLPDHERPVRAFLDRIDLDDSAAVPVLSAEYLRDLEGRVERLEGTLEEDPDTLGPELDGIHDDLVERALATCTDLRQRLERVRDADDPEERSELWTDASRMAATLVEFEEAGLVPPGEYPRRDRKTADGAGDLVADGEFAEDPSVDPRAYERLRSELAALDRVPNSADPFRYVETWGRVEALRADVETADRLLASGQGFESQERYRESRRRLEEVRDEASRRGFGGLVEDVAGLLETSREGQKRAYQAAGGVAGDGAGGAGAATPDVDETVSLDPGAAPSWGSGSDVADSLQAELPDHEVLAHVGSGGNADVHKVRLEENGAVLALKVPQWQGTISRTVVEEFVDEARTWDRLDGHEHVIDLHDFGVDPYPWMLLEFMDLGNLTEQMDAITPAKGVVALIKVCNAVHHAHQHGVAHTDLKPENVMFTSESDGATVKVGDWGLAQVMLEHTETVEGMTPSYAAPEQVDPDTYGSTGPATDVYQLGVMTYEVLTVQKPFAYDSTAAVMNGIVSGNYPAPSDVDGSLGPAVDDVVSTAMATDQSDRYESVLYLRDALRNLGRGDIP